MSLPTEYLQLRDAVLACPDYTSVPEGERPSLKLFMHLMKALDEGREPRIDSIARMYPLALGEARRLRRAGRLPGLELPGIDAPSASTDGGAGTHEVVEPVPAQPVAVRKKPKIEVLERAVQVKVIPGPGANDIPDHIGFDTHGLLRVRVADIKPNPINDTVFTSSLGDESIRALAEDIRARKLQNPIQVRPDLVTPDGERRRRALLLLGVEETYVRVVHGIDTPEQIEGYIWDSYSSGRDATLDERVKLYQLAQRVLQRRHGRPRGRPSGKSSPNDELFWSPSQVKESAAKRAGFGSEAIADRAVSVFERGDADLVARVIAGEVTISAAYTKLSKPKPAKKGTGKQKAAKEDSSTDKSADTSPPDTQDADTSTTPADQESPPPGSPPEPPATGEDKASDPTSTTTTTDTSPTLPPTADATTEHADARTPTTTTTVPSTSATAIAADATTDPDASDDGSIGTDAEPDAEQLPITYKAARAVVWAALQADRELAERELIDLAAHAEIDVVTLGNDPRDNLDELWSRVREALAELDQDAVTDWIDGVIDECKELRPGFEPDGEDDAELVETDDPDAYEEDDDAGRTTKRRSSGGIRCPVREMEE